LMPYIWQEAQHSARTGEPMMRALKLWDAKASDYQYFFGRDLLVCPVVEPNAKIWQVFFRDGEGVGLWTEQRFSGGGTIEVNAPIDTIPVFVRAGASIPVRLEGQQALGRAVGLSGVGDAVLTFG